MNVGFNPVQTASPGNTVLYQWYAGDVMVDPNNFGVATPIEFGATNLSPADPIKHTNKGAIGALIIEPKGSTWNDQFGSRAQIYVKKADGTIFRELVTIFQNDINLRYKGFNGEATTELGIAVPNLAEAEDPEDSGQKAVNYRTEPLWKRLGYPPDTPLEKTREFDHTKVLTNNIVGGQDPVTPVFTAMAGGGGCGRLLGPRGPPPHPVHPPHRLHRHKTRAPRGTPQAELLHRMLQLFGRELGKKVSDHAVQMTGALDAGAIENFDQPPSADLRAVFMVVVLLLVLVSLTPPFDRKMNGKRQPFSGRKRNLTFIFHFRRSI